ncbi:MAG: hypothetical protein SGJ00_07580 [bacterium]|nr:hypothetical protein [bacterium]
MELVKGNFTGSYSGVGLNNFSIHQLHEANFNTGAVLSNATIITEEEKIALLSNDHIPFTIIRAVHVYYKTTTINAPLNALENLYECYLFEHLVASNQNHDYGKTGKVSGILVATILDAQPPSLVDSSQFDNSNIITEQTHLANGKNEGNKGSLFDGCLSNLWWLLVLLFLLWLLFQFKDCNTHPKPLPVIDSTEVKIPSDTITLYNSKLTISLYDWDIPDDDIINVYMNDELRVKELILQGRVYSWMEELKPGNNYLKLEAVSNGKIRNCSPTIEINDQAGTLIFKTDFKVGKPVTYIIKTAH